MILILAQLALLLLTVWGWGFWLWKFSRAAQFPGWKRHGWFFFGLAGLMSCVLFLHALIYFNLTLKWTSWAGLLVAVAGVVGSLVSRWHLPLSRRTLHRHHQREIVAASLLFVTVFGFQSAPLFHVGPANYYGSAHTDQVNYVLLAEFLTEKPYSTSDGDIGLQPWLVKALALKGSRLGQSIANGYLGVVSLSDAKRSYGTLSIFIVSVGALSVFILARVLSVPRVLATLAGIWWGILPAVTKIHLDGFFSQTCILFVFPAMAAVFYVRRGRLERIPLLLLTLYLAYLLCTYTEVYVLGVGLVVSLFVFAARPGTPWWLRISAGAAVMVGSLALTGSYARYFFHYIGSQYRIAATPLALAELTPMSGTWIGWKQIFFGYEPVADARFERLSLLAGFALLFFIGCAFQGRGLTKRRFLLALLAPPMGVLTLLLSAPEFSKYPFSKLLDTFTTFWLVFVVLGILYLRGLLARLPLLGRALTWMIIAVFVLAAFSGSRPQWRATSNDLGILADVDSPGARLCYVQAQNHQKAIYLIDEPHNLVCAWMAYAARHSKVYIDADMITDQPIPATLYDFRKLPAFSPALVVLDEKGPKKLDDYQGPPNLLVRNPQGLDGGGENTFYWIGPDATLELVDYSASNHPPRRFSLEFVAMAGPANPIHERSLVLVGPDGHEQKLDFTSSTMGRFEVDVHPGKNIYTLKVAYPTEQTFKIPSDPRDHMVRVQQFALTRIPTEAPKIEQ